MNSKTKPSSLSIGNRIDFYMLFLDKLISQFINLSSSSKDMIESERLRIQIHDTTIIINCLIKERDKTSSIPAIPIPIPIPIPIQSLKALPIQPLNAIPKAKRKRNPNPKPKKRKEPDPKKYVIINYKGIRICKFIKKKTIGNKDFFKCSVATCEGNAYYDHSTGEFVQNHLCNKRLHLVIIKKRSFKIKTQESNCMTIKNVIDLAIQVNDAKKTINYPMEMRKFNEELEKLTEDNEGDNDDDNSNITLVIDWLKNTKKCKL